MAGPGLTDDPAWGEGGLAPALQGRMLTLKHADTFGVFNTYGDIRGTVEQPGSRDAADGLFQDDTRVLSRFLLRIAGRRPEILAAAVSEDNALLTVDGTTPPCRDLDGASLPTGQLHLRRRRYLWDRAMHEALVITNYGAMSCRIAVDLDFAADFLDLFEVRGSTRTHRGVLSESRVGERSVTLLYDELDGRSRSTTLSFSEAPKQLSGEQARFEVTLSPGGRWCLFIAVHADRKEPPLPNRAIFLAGLRQNKRAIRRCVPSLRNVRTSNQRFDHWIGRAAADLALLTTEMATGPYPYAGIPWFSVPFGRDAVITGLQTLWLAPDLARGTLEFLAAKQATESSTFWDSAPGKIMHETRKGEMSRLDEVPFRHYFGGVDTTPLFVMLAGAYFRRTGDVAFIRTLWPALTRALAWVDASCEYPGGFLAYQRGEDSGLQNQGWKDSHDSVFHADGNLAEGPIALAEVQGYVFAARMAAADMARALGDEDMAQACRESARTLRKRFDAAFWQEDLGTYALALDGGGEPCRVRASNAGHTLFTGIALPDRAEAVMRQLMGLDFYTGWGIRTLAEGEPRYNPMAYHNGSVWPHDCSLIGAGMARYGWRNATARILGGLFDAAQRFADFRLPELFCGFRRRSGEAPATYPSACFPQAWASGAPFLLLQACLGLDVDGRRQVITVTAPTLPPFLDEVSVTGLQVGEGRADLMFRREGDRVEAGLLDASPGISLKRSRF